MRKRFLAVAAATVMTMSMAMTAMAAAPDGYDAYYSFDDTLDNGVSGGEAATLTGSKINDEVSATEPTYVEGASGKAIDLTGAGSYGVCLGKVITGEAFTVSFKVKIHAATNFTAVMFIESMNGDTSSENWLGMNAVNAGGTFDGTAPRLWSKYDATYFMATPQVEDTGIKLDTWHTVTYVQDGTTGTLYLDGQAIIKGNIQDADKEVNTSTYTIAQNLVNEDTRLFFGVNYWDTPFNGSIDEVYVYNKALTIEEVGQLHDTEITDTTTTPEIPEDVTFAPPQLADENDPNIFAVEEDAGEDEADNTMMIVIIAIVAVVVVVIIIAVVVASKKKNASSDDEE